MSRFKKRPKIFHVPDTKEIFMSLSSMPSWSEILLLTYPEKPYSKFLKHLLSVKFYIEDEMRFKIKEVAKDAKIQPQKATKWIKQIYEEIIALNMESPQLFRKGGATVFISMKYFDDSLNLNISLSKLPRIHENIEFPFAKAKVGTSRFWVKNIEYSINDEETEIWVATEGGIHNKYREFILDRALFNHRLGFMDEYHMGASQLDEELKRIYRE